MRKQKQPDAGDTTAGEQKKVKGVSGYAYKTPSSIMNALDAAIEQSQAAEEAQVTSARSGCGCGGR